MAATNSTPLERTMPDELPDFPEKVLCRQFLKDHQFQFCVQVIKFSWWKSTFSLQELTKFDAAFLATNCFWNVQDEKKRKKDAAMVLQMAKDAAEGKGLGRKSTQIIVGRLKTMLQKAREAYETNKETLEEDTEDMEADVSNWNEEAYDGDEMDEEDADDGDKMDEEETKDDDGNEVKSDDDETEDVEENVEPADLSFEHDHFVQHGGPPKFLTPATEPLVQLPEPDHTDRKEEVTGVSEGQQLLSNCSWFSSEEDGDWILVTCRCVYSSILNAIIALIHLSEQEWVRSVVSYNSPLEFQNFVSLALEAETNNISPEIQYYSLRLINFLKQAQGSVVRGEVAPTDVMSELKAKAGEQVKYCCKCRVFSKTALHLVTLSQLEELRAGKQPKVSACPQCDGKRISHMRLNQLGFPVAIPQREGDPATIARLFQEKIMTEKVWVGNQQYQVRAAVVTYAVENLRHCVTLMPPPKSSNNNPDLWQVLDSNFPEEPQNLIDYGAFKGSLDLVFYLP